MPPRKPSKKVEALKHEEAKRCNIPTAEHQSVMSAFYGWEARSPSIEQNLP